MMLNQKDMILGVFEMEQGLMTVVDSTAYENPAMWGIVLADCVQHIVNAYVAQGIAPMECKAAILELFEAEIARPTSKAKTVVESAGDA